MFGVTADGQRGWKEQGADTVHPFSSAKIVARQSYTWYVHPNGCSRVTYTIIGDNPNNTDTNNTVYGCTEELQGEDIFDTSKYTKIGVTVYGTATKTATFEFGSQYKTLRMYCLKKWTDIKFERIKCCIRLYFVYAYIRLMIIGYYCFLSAYCHRMFSSGGVDIYIIPIAYCCYVGIVILTRS